MIIRKIKLLQILVLVVCVSITGSIVSAGDDARSVILKLFKNDNTNDSKFTVTMKLVDKDGTARESTYNLWRKRTGNNSMSMMKFTAPARDKNIGLLIQSKNSAAQQWLFLPKLNEVKRIAGSGKSKAFMGSDFSYEDLEPKNVDDYNYSFESQSANFKGRPCYIIESKPKPGVVSGYSKTKLWVDKEKHVIHKTIFYEGSRMKKVLYNKNFTTIGGVITARLVEMISLSGGHKTVMSINNVNHNTGVANTYFTQRYLKRKK